MSVSKWVMRSEAAWPNIDRCLWEAAQSSPYVFTLSPEAINLANRGYNCWINHLASLESFDELTYPADRVTFDSVKTYIEYLYELGGKRSTVCLRIRELGAALRIMIPERSFSWLQPSKLLNDCPSQKQVSNEDHQLRGWPVADRELWLTGFQVGDILENPNYAAKLSPRTINEVIVGYRRWLVFLHSQGQLNSETLPASRVTRENVIAYVKDVQRKSGNGHLVNLLFWLKCTMKIMHPDADFQWLTSPRGRALSTFFPRSQNHNSAFDSKFLYDWGRMLIQQAIAEPNPEIRRITYRNGLLIALFAARAPRVRSMESLRLGHTITLIGNTYRMVFEKEDVKTCRSIEYKVPAGLSADIKRYIDVERTELMDTRNHSWFWVNLNGDKLNASGITYIIRQQSKKDFGKSFGPHTFRHAMGTTAPLADPAHPGVAAAVLGISSRMVEKHYNRANQAAVAHRFHASIAKDRALLRSLSSRRFRRSS